MFWTLLDRTKEAADLVRVELTDAGITYRQAADWFGIPKSTLEGFLNYRHTTRGNHHTTIDALLAVEGWQPETRAALVALRNHNAQTLRAKFGPSAEERGRPPLH